MKRPTLLTGSVFIAAAIGLATASLMVASQSASSRSSQEHFSHYDVIAPKEVTADHSGKCSFTIRLIPRNLDCPALIEIYPSCDCLTTGDRSVIAAVGEEIRFEMTGKTHDNVPREWNVHIRAREHSSAESSVVRDIPVNPAVVAVSYTGHADER